MQGNEVRPLSSLLTIHRYIYRCVFSRLKGATKAGSDATESFSKDIYEVSHYKTRESEQVGEWRQQALNSSESGIWDEKKTE